MVLIIVLGLIVNLAFDSDDCKFVTLKVKDFDWNKVGISV